jgi:uncharacterized membrane protein YhaH (DUF805 family)
VSGPYSPYGTPDGGQYGAPGDGQYGQPGGSPYGQQPGGSPYDQPGGSPYDQPGGSPYDQPGGTPYGQPGGSPYGAPGGYAPQGYPPPQRGYLQGGPVDFQSAIRLQIENVTNFEGRASLSAYWWYALALAIVDVVLFTFSIAIGSAALSLLVDLVLFVVGLSALSVGARRLHDTDKSGWLLLLGLIPLIGGIIVLVLLVLPGTPSQNRFG